MPDCLINILQGGTTRFDLIGYGIEEEAESVEILLTSLFQKP